MRVKEKKQGKKSSQRRKASRSRKKKRETIEGKDNWTKGRVAKERGGGKKRRGQWCTKKESKEKVLRRENANGKARPELPSEKKKWARTRRGLPRKVRKSWRDCTRYLLGGGKEKQKGHARWVLRLLGKNMGGGGGKKKKKTRARGRKTNRDGRAAEERGARGLG